jgi:recombinational DNA repair ATPase RecF
VTDKQKQLVALDMKRQELLMQLTEMQKQRTISPKSEPDLRKTTRRQVERLHFSDDEIASPELRNSGNKA